MNSGDHQTTLDADLQHAATLLANPGVGNFDGERARQRLLATMFNLELEPAKIADYVLLRKIGEGGMGQVYVAYDQKLDRKVAIKLIRTKHDPILRVRSRREAQGMARLSHPNIVQVHEIGELPEATFIVMEYVEGKTLREWLADPESPPSQSEILKTFMQAGRGLVEAHASSLVHRDFKPDNVLVSPDLRVLVTDFGLVSDLGAEIDAFRDDEESFEMGLTNLRLTKTGALMGTPAYMSPEQFLGQQVDERSDQFSFCVALYEALHGELPFDGATLPELARAVTGGDVRPKPPRSRVPAALRAVLLRGLRADPLQRWTSMEELLRALEQAHEPILPKRWIAAASFALLAGGWGIIELVRALLD